MILGISGLSGAGKDTVADIMVKHHDIVKVSLADPLKRICRDVFDFTYDQLWGPSEKRNEVDKRYPRVMATTTNDGPNHEFPIAWLTPRYALQQLGTQWGRGCYDNVWIDYALRVAKEVLDASGNDDFVSTYSAKSGLREVRTYEAKPVDGIVIPDVRFKNEMNAISEAGGKVIRIKRPSKETPEWDHASETEQLSVPDEWFDYVFINDGSLWGLEDKVATMLSKLGGENES